MKPSIDLNTLEAAVDRDLALLRDLPAAAPSAALRGRMVHALLRDHRARARRRRGWLWAAPAAAAGLVLLLNASTPTAPRGLTAPSVEEELRQWTAAADRATDRLAALLQPPPAPVDNDRVDVESVDELLESFDLIFGGTS